MCHAGNPTQENLATQNSLVFSARSVHEKLVRMSIHLAISRRRAELGLSLFELAKRISDLEGLARPLAWQTVQQWENGKSAPKRKRLEFAAQALQTSVNALMESDQPAAGGNVTQFPQAPSGAWPFRFDRARFDRLDERDKGAVERAALEMLERVEADLEKRHGT